MPIKSLSQSSLLNFQKYSSMLAGNDPFSPSAYDLLETQTLGTAAASVTFTGLGSYSDYKHLQIRVTARTDRSAFSDLLSITFNSDTGSNYAAHRLFGDGSSVNSGAFTSQARMLNGYLTTTSNTADVFGAVVLDVLDFSSSSKNTTIRSLSGAVPSSYENVGLHSGFWNSTSAITSMALSNVEGSNFVTGSRFSLYGIKGA